MLWPQGYFYQFRECTCKDTVKNVATDTDFVRVAEDSGLGGNGGDVRGEGAVEDWYQDCFIYYHLQPIVLSLLVTLNLAYLSSVL